MFTQIKHLITEKFKLNSHVFTSSKKEIQHVIESDHIFFSVTCMPDQNVDLTRNSFVIEKKKCYLQHYTHNVL